MTGAPNLRVIADRLFKTVAAMLVIFLLMQLILFEANMRTRRRAESLLLSMKKLKVGTTALADVQPLVSSFNAEKTSWRSNCPSGDSDYAISVTNAFIDRLGDYHPVLLRAGIRPGGVGAVLSFKGDRLCGFSYSVGTLLLGSQYPLQIPSLNDAHLIAVGGTSTVQAPNGAQKYEIMYHNAFLGGFYESGRSLGVNVDVSPDASPTELQHALNFDLACFASFRGCQLICQLMPSIAQDCIQQEATEGIPIPEGIQMESESSLCSGSRTTQR